jgi:hypothetical protein
MGSETSSSTQIENNINTDNTPDISLDDQKNDKSKDKSKDATTETTTKFCWTCLGSGDRIVIIDIRCQYCRMTPPYIIHNRNCYKCHGSGIYSETLRKDCPNCLGKGYY